MNELIKIHDPEFNKQEIQILSQFLEENSKIKPIFNLKGFLFGPFYLIYKKAYIEALAVIVVSLLLVQIGFILHSFIFLGLGTILPNILGGWFFYFMYANKLDRDIESCGKPIDKTCLGQKGGKSIGALVGSVLFVLFLFWPVIYGKLTNQDITKDQQKYTKKVVDILK